MFQPVRFGSNGGHCMDLFGEALSISGMSIVMVFGVLVLLMLAIQLSSLVFGKAEPKTTEKVTPSTTQAPATRAPVRTSGKSDEEQVSVILAALEAAQIDVPPGGRVRIEKVSRRS